MLAANPGMRLAVLIDGDNVASKNADAIFARLAGLGETPIRRLYGNLVDSTTRDWQPAIGRHAITARQQIPLTPLKNAADIALAVDAMDILHAGGIDGFCIVSSDCDFTPLAIRLRELLREDAGGVYGVAVAGGISREPVNDYSISINFGCAPENVDKLVALVMQEITRTKQTGIAQETLDKVVVEQTRGLENSMKENAYWRYLLEQQFFRNNDPLKILQAADRIRQITPARTQTLANRFFNNENVARIVLLPESNKK